MLKGHKFFVILKGITLNKIVRIRNGKKKSGIFFFLRTVTLKQCISYAPTTHYIVVFASCYDIYQSNIL